MTENNIYSAFRASAVRGNTFIVAAAGQTRYTYADLHRRSGQYANKLCQLGLEPGDRVMVQVEKSVECVCLYLACLRGGFIYLPLNTAYLDDELRYFIADARPALVVCAPASESRFSRLLANQASKLATLDSDGTGSLNQDMIATDFPSAFTSPTTTADTIAVILYTSGTTGRPKGAMISHANLLANAQALSKTWDWQASDVLLHALPIFHIHGLFVALNVALLNASPIIFLPRFDPDLVTRALPSATVYMGVPTHYVRLLNQGELTPQACAGMRLFTSGSAPLLTRTFEAFVDTTGHRIVERYGMTETGITTSNPFHGRRKPGTVGLPLPGVDARLVDDKGMPCEVGQTGELQVKGPGIFSGYWQMPEKTREEFTPDGFLKTGDLAQQDADGYFAIVGRSKDMIISGGLNVYPKEIEALLDKLPGVLESAVIGVADADFGEAVNAVIVLKPGITMTEAEVIQWMKQELANFKVAKRVHFVEALPRNTMGKVQKNLLRDRYNASSTGQPQD